MMSSKFNSRDSYAGGQEETRRDAALSGTPDGGERVQLSAEEIAAVLAESYFGGKVVTGDEDSGREDSFHTEETLTAEKEREARRRQRVQEMRRRKKRQEQLRRLMLPGIVAAVVFVILAGLGIGGLVQRFFDAHILSRLFLTSIFPVKCFGC